MTQTPTPLVSVVMPCLNEADTVATCVGKALRAMREHDIPGEVVVADNGSTDASAEIAERLGARVVPVVARGYGNALMGGIAAAGGTYIIMGDADDSYDFGEVPRFVAKLREGYDLVQGCRLPSGGGKIEPGAMPFLHRWLGNPALSWLARLMFRAPVHDVYCGMRGFTRECYDRLGLRSTGMEFATEMVIKASLYKERIAEVPITLHPDGRKAHPPHLRTFRDGWRSLRFFLLSSPRWLFVYPGLLLVVLGLVGYAVAFPGLRLAGVTFDAHTLLVASLALMLGYQAVWFGLVSKTIAVREGLLPADAKLRRFYERTGVEKGLLVGALGFVAGLSFLGIALSQWWQAGLGDLDYGHTMRAVVPGVTLCALSAQTVFGSFLLGILGSVQR